MPILIENNGGHSIQISNNNIKFNTKGNCTIHTFVNFIIKILIKIKENKFLCRDNKKSLLILIIKNLINSVRNIDKNEIYMESTKHLNKKEVEKKYGPERRFAFSNHPEISEEEFLKLFDITFETNNPEEILKDGINSNNEKLINFLIKIYDINVLFFRDGYNFELNNKKINVQDFTSYDIFIYQLYKFFLCILPENIFFEKNLIKNSIKINNINLFGNIYITPNHIENIIFLKDDTEINEYTNILKKLNEKRSDSELKTKNTFYINHKYIQFDKIIKL